MSMAKMVTLESYGSTKNISGFFRKARQINFVKELSVYGEIGAELLAMATPIDTGESANSWDYEIEETDGQINLYWTNSNIADYVPVVILLQYGHATRNGGYVPPHDFINPVLEAVFEDIANTIWREMVRL